MMGNVPLDQRLARSTCFDYSARSRAQHADAAIHQRLRPHSMRWAGPRSIHSGGSRGGWTLSTEDVERRPVLLRADLLFDRRNEGRMRIPLDWKLEELVVRK